MVTTKDLQARVQRYRTENAKLKKTLEGLKEAPMLAFNYNGSVLFIKKVDSFYHIEIPGQKIDECLMCSQKKKLRAHHLFPRRAHVKHPILKELRASICKDCEELVHPENLVDSQGIIARQNNHIIQLQEDMLALKKRKDDKIIKFLDKRIAKLEKDVKNVHTMIKNKRRIHPAHKHMEGRIRELKYFRKSYINILNS